MLVAPSLRSVAVSEPYSLGQTSQGGAVTSQIHATVTIDRPVEKVLEFVDDPATLARCAPMVERVVHAGRSTPRVGDSFQIVYRILGLRFNEAFTVIGFEPPRRNTPHRRFQIWETVQGGLRGTLTWTLEAEGNQTYASVDVAYQLMGGLFGRAVDALLIERAVRKDVGQMLENMKRQLGALTA